MFSSWGTVMSRFRWLVLALAVVFLAVAGGWGTGVFSQLSGSSSLDDPASESQRINQQVLADFGPQSEDIVALYSSTNATVDDPQFATVVKAAEARVHGMAGVSTVTSYYDDRSPSFVSADRHETYIAVRLVSNTSDGKANKIGHALRTTDLNTMIGGQRAVDSAMRTGCRLTSRGPRRSACRSWCWPCWVFGSLVAACMPVLIGGFAVLGAFLVLRVITLFTTVSIFSLNIITILGMGLAVDYGLFIVSRFREELDRGRSAPEAVSRTMATAGRTVAVSGVLVALALSSLMIFPQVLLHSMGLGGAAAVLVAMLSSLTVLPALLAVLGPKVDAGRLPWSRRKRIPTLTGTVAGLAAAGSSENGRWARIAQGVMRRPVPVLIGIVVLLGVLSAPFARVHFGGIDERMSPPGTQPGGLRAAGGRLHRRWHPADPGAGRQRLGGRCHGVPGLGRLGARCRGGDGGRTEGCVVRGREHPAEREHSAYCQLQWRCQLGRRAAHRQGDTCAAPTGRLCGDGRWHQCQRGRPAALAVVPAALDGAVGRGDHLCGAGNRVRLGDRRSRRS